MSDGRKAVYEDDMERHEALREQARKKRAERLVKIGHDEVLARIERVETKLTVLLALDPQLTAHGHRLLQSMAEILRTLTKPVEGESQ